jgi:hypothetical protein
MMDFGITNSGDLDLKSQTASDGFQLRFRHGDMPGLQVSFFLSGSESAETQGQFSMSFKTVQTAAGNVVSPTVLEEDEELMQQIRIAFATELAELPKRTEVGSDIISQRHKPLRDEIVLTALEDAAVNALATILPGATVIAKPEKGDGYLYCRHVSLYVYRNEKLLTRVAVY